MSVGMSVDLERGVRIFVFSDIVTPADFDFVGRLYNDRDHYRFTDREIVFFTPDVSLAQIETGDIGSLADSYFEALRTRNDAIADQTIWVMPEQVRGDARLWREFTRDPEKSLKTRAYVETLEAALSAYKIPAAWLDHVRQGRGFLDFGEVGALRAAAPAA